MSEQEVVADAQPTEEAQNTEASVERPEWLPEKFKSPEDLSTAYSSLESKLGQKDEEIRATVEKEMQDKFYEERPAEKGDYILPEGIDDVMAADNELLNWWADTAFESGYNQEQFQKGIGMYMEALNEGVPDYDSELSKLGDSANDRTEAVSLFANQFFPESQLGAIERMCETADGVMALETIMENMRDSSPSLGGTAPSGVNEAQLQQMMLDDRYHNPTKRDKEFVRQVEDGFKKLYG